MDGFNLAQGRMENHIFAEHQTQGYQNIGNVTIPVKNGVSILDLKPGDCFQGEIVSVGGEEVQLKLANEQMLAAKMESSVQLAIDQILGFQVQSNQNGKIVLKPVYQNPLQMQVGEAALKTAGIAVNEKNMQLVAQMIENGLPIDKNSMQAVYRQILQHPQEKVETILQLNKLHMPVTETNLRQCESYQNRSCYLQSATEDVAENIIDIYKALKTAENPLQENAEVLLQKPMTEENMQMIQKPVTEENMQMMQKPVTEEILQKPLTEEQTIQTLTSETEGKPVQNVSKEADIQNAPGSLPETGKGAMQETVLKPEEQTVSAIQKQILWAQPEKATGFLKQTLQILDLDMQPPFSEVWDMPLEWQEDFFKSEDFSKALETALKEKWSLEPQDVSAKEKVDKFYEKITRQVMQLSEFTEEVIKQATVQNKGIQNMSQNLQFMHELNQVFQYVQLPLKLAGNHANGELYVYTNKKRLTKKEGTVTAFLHLDMEHMGTVNVHVALDGPKNRVTTRFEIEQDVIPLFTSCMGELDKKLEKLGYRVKSVVSPLQETKTVLLQAQEQVGAVNVPLTYQTFDMRA